MVEMMLRQSVSREQHIGYSYGLVKGLGTCINGQGIMCPDVVRKATGLPESKNMYISIAIGYPGDEHPSNRRSATGNLLIWCHSLSDRAARVLGCRFPLTPRTDPC